MFSKKKKKIVFNMITRLLSLGERMLSWTLGLNITNFEKRDKIFYFQLDSYQAKAEGTSA